MSAASEGIGCPVVWCSGLRMDHGGDGAEPGDWVHSDEGRELVHGAALYRSQIGSGAVEWEMVVGGQTIAVGRDLALLAEKLRDIAGAVESVAVTG